jgi:hypothetical protein
MLRAGTVVDATLIDAPRTIQARRFHVPWQHFTDAAGVLNSILEVS